ncbi:AraC-type DNA-binding protein [Oryzisolibacter propanilivorax]|uniref:AraC-type DNA-binding protein n=1 Tax=Oryzisolibacter propanilivorax TaxID=1527607 RepID=A0A1G9VJJ8_9BURK|nr:AraC family transcriptional regulator [Oryzisolibacter propanilivorax]SDM72280.1 AraC-type DNA-binding protein [Oryzisolibacter propanilivorax]
MYTPSLPAHRLGPRQGGVAATPMAFVRAVVQAYAQRRLDAAGVLARAQIAPAQLADAEARITAWQMEVLCDGAMRELDDEALGWFERRLPWGSYGMLARAALSAPTLGRALARWCRQHGLLTQAIGLRLQEADGQATLAIDEMRDLGDLREFCLVSTLRNALGLASWFIDSRLPLLQADFPFAAPAHASAYAVLFPAPVRFDAPRAAVHVDARYLQLPLVRDAAAMDRMLQHALPLTVRPYRRDRLLVQRVRQLLAQGPEAPGDAAALAAALHLSPRTLHRQLAAEGASLQRLKDEARRARATELLLRSDRPIKQVAQAVGFASEKTFIRAFRAWTGQAPARFRQAARAGGAPLPPDKP